MKNKLSATERDRAIISFVEKNGFITIKQCADLFFDGKYDGARIRLKKLYNTGRYFKTIENKHNINALINKGVIYVPLESTTKEVTYHDILIVDYLCRLTKSCFEILGIKKHYRINELEVDALIKISYEKNNKKYIAYQLLEVQRRHATVDTDRLNRIHIRKKILEDTNQNMPTIIIMEDTKVQYKYNPGDFKVIKIGTKFEHFSRILNEYYGIDKEWDDSCF